MMKLAGRRVFLSSVVGELAAERAAARSVIESLHLVPVDDGAGPDQASTSDVFIAIYWQDSAGLRLEDEYRAAWGGPCLVYVKEPAPGRDPQLAALIDRIRDAGVQITVISGPADLAERLTDDLANLVSRLGPASRQLPSGTVTFLFADVEDSTPNLERFGASYADLLARFLRDGEALIESHGGTLVKTEGDGLFAAFTQADQALNAALAAQRTFLGYPSPGPMRVRMGLHSGSGVVVDGDYVGLDVNRAARVAAAAHGGQILVSAATRELIEPSGDVTVSDLGWYELKGLSRPEHLHQVTGPDLPTHFPPPRARASYRAWLPPQLTTLVGREADVAEVADLLDSGVRLLTLTGPGGIGKTRLAAAVAEKMEAHYRDGVGFIGLAAVGDPDRVAETIATGLGRTMEGTASPEDVIVDELADRRFLLVLDNFEQVTDCAPLLRRLLERLPGLQLLVTSRIALRLSVEREYEVEPLQLPGADSLPDEVERAAAVRLLLDRARAARPGLEVTDDNFAAIAELVRRLDGLPLAIELAAARLRLLEPAEVLARLGSVLELGEGAADLPDRQRTLRAAIDWSYRLLTESEQILFRRLGVFVDGWTLEAAEEVAGGPDVGDVMGGLDTLASHSIVRLETIPGLGRRMRLLGPLRDYARELLAAGGDLERTRERHADYFVRTVEGYPRGTGVGLWDWKRRMDAEWGNIRQAIVWLVGRSAHLGVARFLAALWPLLWIEDRIEETRSWLAELRPHLDGLPKELRAQVIHVDGFFALEAGDLEHALEWALEAIVAAEELDDEELRGRSQLLAAGSMAAFDMDDARMLAWIEDAIQTFRRRGDIVNLAYALNFYCAYQASRGNLDQARRAIEEARLLAADVEALPIGPQSSAALAFVDLLSGDLAAAEQHLAAAVKGLDALPSREILSYVLDGYGWLRLVEGHEIAGLTALGAAEGIRERIGLRPWPLTSAQIDLLAQMADSYQDPEAQAARRAGRDLTPEAALAVVTS